MDWLKKSTLMRLRDQLRERGQQPSVRLPVANLPPQAMELLAVTAEYGALCEAMYMMMAADGKVTEAERDVLKGALRTLTEDSVRSVHIEAMLDSATKRLVAEGRETRLAAVIDALCKDPVKAEVALVLAAAVAFADDVLHPEEDAFLQRLAEGLHIDGLRTHELVEQLKRDVAGKGKKG